MAPSILIVDDHQLYRSMLSTLIQTCWPLAQIREAADASQALTLFPQQRWAVILLDYQLPTLSGGDLVRHLRVCPDARGLPLPPLVLMSTQPDVTYFARALGAVAFLPKPVEVSELCSVLAPYLDEAIPPACSHPPPLTSPALSRSPAAHSGAPATPRLAPQQPLSAPVASPAMALGTTNLMATGSAVPLRTRRLKHAIERHVQHTLTSYPPPYPPSVAVQVGRQPRRIGDYLVQLGYLTPWQLTRALRLARPPTCPARLGFTLVAESLVGAPVLSAVLLQQFLDRLELDLATAPRFLGERLLLRAQLAPAQLALALQEQLDRYQQGQWVRLGELIVRYGWLERAVIRAALLDPPRVAAASAMPKGAR